MINPTLKTEEMLKQFHLEKSYSDLRAKLSKSIKDGTFLDAEEVHLVMLIMAHCAGIEKAFEVFFSSLENHEIIKTLTKKNDANRKN